MSTILMNSMNNDNEDFGMGGLVTSYHQKDKMNRDLREFEQSLKQKRKKRKINRKQQRQQPRPQPPPTDFTYTHLLNRAFTQLYPNQNLDGKQNDDDKDLLSLKKKNQKIPDPKVGLSGSKTTMWANMLQICRVLKRNPQHLQQFVEAELTTDCRFDGSHNFILAGRWRKENIRSVLTKYINLYVLCENCKSLNTKMSKNASTRLYELDCNQCHSQKSCQKIQKAYRTIANKAQRIQQRQQNQS